MHIPCYAVKRFMKNIFPPLCLLLSVIACSQLNRRQAEYFTHSGKYWVRLNSDGSCLIPRPGPLSDSIMQCSYQIDGNRIQFNMPDGTATVAKITKDNTECIEFNDGQFCRR